MFYRKMGKERSLNVFSHWHFNGGFSCGLNLVLLNENPLFEHENFPKTSITTVAQTAVKFFTPIMYCLKHTIF